MAMVVAGPEPGRCLTPAEVPNILATFSVGMLEANGVVGSNIPIAIAARRDGGEVERGCAIQQALPALDAMPRDIPFPLASDVSQPECRPA